MSWSREEAQALLKLRVLKQNKEDWDNFFKELKWSWSYINFADAIRCSDFLDKSFYL